MALMLMRIVILCSLMLVIVEKRLRSLVAMPAWHSRAAYEFGSYYCGWWRIIDVAWGNRWEKRLIVTYRVELIVIDEEFCVVFEICGRGNYGIRKDVMKFKSVSAIWISEGMSNRKSDFVPLSHFLSLFLSFWTSLFCVQVTLWMTGITTWVRSHDRKRKSSGNY